MANATITVIGNLGSDAETKTLPSGKTITNLNLAYTPRTKRGNDWVDGETMWFRVTSWEELPSLVYCKGVKVIVTGALTKSSYTAKDGTQKESLEINADTIGVVSKVETREKANVDPWANAPTIASATELADMPF